MNLFLIPASHENLKTTILFSVPLARVEDALRRVGKLEHVKSFLNGRQSFYCWATTEADRATFESMNRGDRVLFAVNQTPAFRHAATILGKIESEEIGNLLWPNVKRLPWNLIFFVGEIKHFNVPKKIVLGEIGYSPTDAANISRVQQIRRVADGYLLNIIVKFKTIPSFLGWLLNYQK